MELKIEYLPVDMLKPYSKNAKVHDSTQVSHIANSIREFGFRQPIVIDKDNVIVIGHGRLLAAKELGLETVPCARADDLNDEQIKALRLADNKTNESEWDIDLLNVELDNIFDIDMEQFGFENDVIADSDIEGGEIEDNTDVEVAVKIVFKNTKHWRQCEERVRSFVDDMDGVSVSVGEFNEDK